MKTINQIKRIINSTRNSKIKFSRANTSFSNTILKKLFCSKSNTNKNERNSTDSEHIQRESKTYSEVVKFLFENNIVKKKVPCFEVYSSQIEILQRPFDFYLAIIVSFKS